MCKSNVVCFWKLLGGTFIIKNNVNATYVMESFIVEMSLLFYEIHAFSFSCSMDKNTYLVLKQPNSILQEVIGV